MDEFAAMGAGVMIFYLAIAIFMIITWWKIFEKAGQPGWAAIIPIYNIIIMLKVAKKEVWWIILLLIPFVNFIIMILVFMAIAENFGKSQAFGIGMVFIGIVFLPILAFGDAKYVG